MAVSRPRFPNRRSPRTRLSRKAELIRSRNPRVELLEDRRVLVVTAADIELAWSQLASAEFNAEGLLNKALGKLNPDANSPTQSQLDSLSTTKSQIQTQLDAAGSGASALASPSASQIVFGFHLEGEVAGTLKPLTQLLNVGIEPKVAAGLSTGFNFTYDTQQRDWTISRLREVQLSASAEQSENTFGSAAEAEAGILFEHFVKLDSLADIGKSLANLTSSDQITVGVKAAIKGSLQGEQWAGVQAKLKHLFQFGAKFSQTLEVEGNLTVEAQTTIGSEEFLQQYVHQTTMLAGLADLYVPFYGDSDSFWDTAIEGFTASPGISYLEALNALRTDTHLGILSRSSDDVTIAAKAGWGLSAGVWGGINGSVGHPLKPIEVGATLKAGIAVSSTSDTTLYSHTFEAWEPGGYEAAELAGRFADKEIEGVTIVTHGFQDSNTGGDSLLPLAQAIRQETDRVNGETGSSWLLDYDIPGERGQGGFDSTQSILPTDDTGSGHAVILFDWAAESNERGNGYGTTAGDALATMLVDLGFVDPANPSESAPLHFIGHSYGTAVTSEAVERLATLGVHVDQVTYLDPHDFVQVPIIDAAQDLGALGQPNGYGATVWNNVSFADVYYQTESPTFPIPLPDGRPIPGAYNVNVTDHPLVTFPNSHSDVWDDFYLSTVSDQDSTTGYAFSRVRGGDDANRPGGNFTTGQDHRFTTTEVLSEFNDIRWEPVASALHIVNGDLEQIGGATADDQLDDLVVPGYMHHGGGGSGRLMRHATSSPELGSYFLRLTHRFTEGSAESSRTAELSVAHNRLTIPPAASMLSFDLRLLAARAINSRGDRLVVRLGQSELQSFELTSDAVSSQFGRVAVNIPSWLRGQAHKLSFEIATGKLTAATNFDVETIVDIDNIRLRTGGRTGDVFPVTLPDLPTDATAIQIVGFSVAGTSGLSSLVNETTRRPGEWKLRGRLDGSMADYGKVVLTERMEARATADAGYFYFVPAVGFEGRVNIDYRFVRGAETFIRSVPANVFGGHSMDTHAGVHSTDTMLSRYQAQQRLRYLGFPDHNGKPLDVDGIIGPLTRSAIELFEAVNDPDRADADADGILDPLTIARLNSLDAPRWSAITHPMLFTADGENYATSWLTTVLSSAATTLNAPLIATLSTASGRSEAEAAGALLPHTGMFIDLDISSFSTSTDNHIATVFQVEAQAIGASLRVVGQTEDFMRLELLPPSSALSSSTVRRLSESIRSAAEALRQASPLSDINSPLALIGVTDTPFSDSGADANNKISLDDAQASSVIDSSTSAQASAIVPHVSMETLTQFSSLVPDRVLGSLLEVFDRSGPISTGDILNRINGIPGMSVSAATLSQSDGMLSIGGLSFCGSNGAGAVLLSCQSVDTEALPEFQSTLEVGSNALLAGIDIDDEILLNLAAGANLDFGIAIDLNDSLSLNDAFFLEINDLTLLASAAIDASNASFGMNLGILGLDVNGPSLDFDVSIGASSGGPISLSQLWNEPLDSLIQTTTNVTGTPSLTLPITVTPAPGIQNFFSLNGNVILAADDPFATPEAQFTGDFAPFANLTAHGLASSLGQVGNWLAELGGTTELGDVLPLARETGIGESLRFSQVWNSITSDRLSSSDGFDLSFTTLQQASGLLADSIAGVDYSNGQLLIDIDLSQTLVTEQAALSLDADLGGLAGFSTDSALNLGGEFNARFSIGIDLNDFAEVSPSTPIAALNSGRGIGTLESGADLRVELRDGTAHEIDLNGIGTMGDLVAAFDAAADLSASLVNANGTQFLRLIDRSSGSGTFAVVRPANGSLAAYGLGILQSDADNNGQIDGTPLSLETIADRLYLVPTSAGDPPAIAGNVSLSATIDATAGALGILDLAINNGSAAGQVSANVRLIDPNADNKITAAELFGQLGDVATIDIGGAADMNLPVAASLAGVSQSGSPAIAVTWPDLFDVSSIRLAPNPDMEHLLEVAELEISNLLGTGGALDETLGYLTQVEQLEFLNETLPVINRSLAELLGIGDTFSGFLATVDDTPTRTLAALEEVLQRQWEGKLAGGAVSLRYDPTVPALRIELGVDSTDIASLIQDPATANGLALAIQESVNLDLSHLGLQSLESLIDFRGQAMLDVFASVDLNLSLGIDLGDPNDPRPFLDTNDTSIEATALVRGQNMQFTAAVGPFGVQIGSGGADSFLVFNEDGDTGTATPARFDLGVSDTDADGRMYFDHLGQANLSHSLTAALNVELPTFKQTTGGREVLDAAQHAINVAVDLTSDPGAIGNWLNTSSFPDFSAAFNDVGDLADELYALADGWDGFFRILDDALDGEVFGVELPLIGEELKDASRFLRDLREAGHANLSIAGAASAGFVQQHLFEAVGPGGLDWLQDANGDDLIDVNDVTILVDGNPVQPGAIPPISDSIEFDVKLKQAATLLDSEIAFDIGLPFLGLDVDGGVNVQMGFEATIGFGVSKTKGVYFNTGNEVSNNGIAGDLLFFVEATLPGFDAAGTLGFLKVQATDAGTSVGGTFAVDLADPSGDGMLTLAEVGSTPFSQLIDARFSGSADVRLRLEGSLGGDTRFPSISTDFVLHWDFVNADTATGSATFGGEPEIAFNNIALDVGEFVSGFVGSIVGGINDVLDPVRPIVDFLTTPVPIVSQLAGSPIDLLDLASYFLDGEDKEKVEEAARFVRAVGRLLDLLDVPVNASGLLELGSIDLQADARTIPATQMPVPDVPAGFENPRGRLQAEVAEYFNRAEQVESAPTSSDTGQGLRFPLLENPKNAYKLLLGQDVELVTLDLPRFDFSVAYKQAFAILPPFLFGNVGGLIGVFADFDFGFDTHGFKQFLNTGDPGDIFNGFYFDDHIEGNRDELEIGLEAGFFVEAYTPPIMIPIFPPLSLTVQAGAGGGLFAEVGLDLHDSNRDGRVHLDEVGDPCLFDFAGELSAKLYAWLEVGASIGFFSITLVDVYFDILDVTLFSFEIACDSNPPELAQHEPDGSLRLLTSPSEANNFAVRPGSNSSEVMISSAGHTRMYTGVSSVVAKQ